MLEHHGQRVRQLANFWGYDAYIDEEKHQRNRANSNNALTIRINVVRIGRSGYAEREREN